MIKLPEILFPFLLFLKTDRKCSLPISDNIKEQMKAQMAADSSVTYFIESDMPEWDFKELNGDESFYFNEKGELVITFDETEVAPAYMGAVEFTIPQSVTGNFK